MDKNEQTKTDTNEKRFFVLELSASNIKKIIAVAAAILIIQWALSRYEMILEYAGAVLSVFSPIIIGFCIAFVINLLLNPAERFWDKAWGKLATKASRYRRAVCLVLSTLVVAGLLFSLIFMVVPLFRETLNGFTESLPMYLANLEKILNDIGVWLEGYGFVIPEFNLNADKIIQQVTNFFARYGSNLFDKTLGITTSIFSGIVDFVLAFAFSMYMLALKERLCKFAKKLLYAALPLKTADKTHELVLFVGRTFNSFITGQLAEAVIIGVLCFIGMLIIRIPYAGVISVIIGFTALIPVVGAFFGTALGALFILLVAPIKAVWFVVFIIVLQQIESNLIYPKVVGKSVGLPGILVLASVTVAGGLFGIAGMLVSVPVCSIIYSIIKGFIERNLKNKNLDIQ